MTTRNSTGSSAIASWKRSTSKPNQYRSKTAEVVYKTARDPYEFGVMFKRTMREFNESCLTPMKAFTAKNIERLRKREDASQAVFAHHRSVSVGLISQWERGGKKPQGASVKLLTLVEKNGLDWVA